MSQVSLNQIAINARKDFWVLTTKVWTHGQKYLKVYERADQRCDFFIVFSMLNTWLLIQLDGYLGLLDRSNPHIRMYLNLTPNDRIHFLSQYDTINRASYITKAMFEVEYFLSSLNKGMNLNLSPKYYKLTKDLLQHRGIRSKHKHNVLNAPAHLRNSLHNNGFARYNFKMMMRDKSYKFTKGKMVRFGGWGDIYIFIDELLDVLVKIIDNPKVKAVKSIPHTSMYHVHI
jgi:hypothetical protein